MLFRSFGGEAGKFASEKAMELAMAAGYTGSRLLGLKREIEPTIHTLEEEKNERLRFAKTFVERRQIEEGYGAAMNALTAECYALGEGIKIARVNLEEPGVKPEFVSRVMGSRNAKLAGIVPAPPTKQTGGLIPRTGAYRLHAGERVTPRARASDAKGGASITNNVNVYVTGKIGDPNELGRAVEEAVIRASRRMVMA